MGEFFLGVATALWLGILTSISPCPLATNIAAISFIGRRVGNPRQVFFSGFLYTLGRTLTYLVLGILLVASLVSAPFVSTLLQKYMNKVLGPILIIAGMFLLEMLSFRLPGPGSSGKTQKRVETWGSWGAVLLGVVFALSFCPVSAALFFVSLIPLAVKYQSSVLLPVFYGVGTALPVIVFAVLITLGTRSVAKAFEKLAVVEIWARRVTGAVFIAVGVYLSLTHIFQVFS
jgi:cytochrome c biogenesis protein CcdA